MANSNETTAYGFRIQFKTTRKKKNAEAGSEQEAVDEDAKGHAILDFECYKTHSTTEHENTHKELNE